MATTRRLRSGEPLEAVNCRMYIRIPQDTNHLDGIFYSYENAPGYAGGESVMRSSGGVCPVR